MRLADINLATYNPRKDLKPGDPEYEKLKRSIEEFDCVEPLVWNKRSNRLIGGHQRLKILKEKGIEESEISVVDLEERKEKALNVALNKIEGSWDFTKMADLMTELDDGEFDLELTGFDMSEIEEIMNWTPGDNGKDVIHKKLTERFIVPPFSVLDTRQGYWQERKKAWLALGIQGELGRGIQSTSGNYRSDYGAYQPNYGQRKMAFKSPEGDYGYPVGLLQKYAGTSVFDPVLCEIAYKWFCPRNGIIVDPFAGGSVRGVIASYLGYNYIGIDLSDEQIEANKIQADAILENKKKPEWIIGNSLNIENLCNEVKTDFIFSCPPYFDLEVYTDRAEDLSRLNWQEFKKQYREIIAKSCRLLKDDRFAVFVVSEIRDKKGLHRGFVAYTYECFLSAGMSFYNDIVLINSAGSLPIRAGKYFSAYRKVGKMHQNVLVFYKGDIKKIKENYPKVEVADLENEEQS